MTKKKLIRITTVPISLKFLITGQMKFMQSSGFEVIMMSAEGPEIEEVVAKEGCKHELVPLTRKITPFADLKALWVLYRKLIQHKPDIVHSHTPKAGLIGMMAAWFARVPIRLHTVAGLPLETSTGVKRKLLLFIEKLTYKFSTETWPNSKSLYQYILTHKLAKENKLNIIGEGSSNGIDTSEFDIDTIDNNLLNDIKASIEYSQDYRYLLFVGRVVRDKGIEELVRAFVKLKLEIENLKLLLVGPFESHLDPLSSDVMSMIDQNDDIITTGFSNHVKYYMHLADLFVFPSHREGFPNVPMQAGMMACPVVASRINGNIDIIDDKINGILHEKNNVDDLYEKVYFALTHQEEMKGLAKELKTKIENSFTRPYIQKTILENYQRLLKHAPNG